LQVKTLPITSKTGSDSPTLATIPLHSHHHVRQGLEAQLRQFWAMYTALPTEANRYQLVRLERLLMEI
jgi:hypothetical protein